MTKIQYLVEEAYNNFIGYPDGHPSKSCKEILTDLVEKASQNGLQPLPSEMPTIFKSMITIDLYPTTIWSWIIKNFGTPPAEWWHGLKKGDKFLDCNGISRLYNGFVFLGTDCNGTHEARLCSPYTEPSDKDKLIASFTDEQLKLMKNLKIEEVKP